MKPFREVAVCDDRNMPSPRKTEGASGNIFLECLAYGLLIETRCQNVTWQSREHAEYDKQHSKSRPSLDFQLLCCLPLAEKEYR